MNNLCFLKIHKIVMIIMLFLCSACHTARSGESDSAKTGVPSGPSFNCDKASTAVEKHICASSGLSLLDAKLASTYKEMVGRDPDIKLSQRKWLNQRNNCSLSPRKNVNACLEAAYKERLSELIPTSQSTAEGTGNIQANLTHKEWLEKLNLAGRCTLDEDSNDQRFTAIKKIDDTKYLLLVSCNSGAYQDSHLSFLIKADVEGGTYLPLTWEVPVSSEGGWSIKTRKKLVGNFSFDEKNQTLEVLNRSNGAGTCGSISRYQLSDVSQSQVVTLASARGQEDCFAGLSVDEWPELPANDLRSGLK